ncbi:MAG: sporulation protein YqfD [Clostridia bacterium]|nr:sporulation protein YqfD [Clostridia bacterium]
MLFTRLFQFFRGYLVITVTGKYPERFLNVCAGRHILIWDLFPCSSTVLRCCISNRGFRLLPPVVKKTNVQVKIIKKCGLPALFDRLKQRKWFLAGLGTFFLLLIVLNQFIWKIEITGCETVSVRDLRAALSDCGLKVGTFRPFLDEKQLQNQMLIKMPELAWLWADKSGSKVTVQVKERVPKPAIFDENDYCNIIADKDGVIASMIVRNGAPMVELGDTVRRGDMLVSGLIVSEKGVEPRQIQADAEIYARVWYEKTKAYSLWCPKKNETGKVEKKHTLHLFGWDLNLFFNGQASFAEYTEEVSNRELSFFGKYLGLGVTSRVYREEVTTYEKMSAESVAQSGALELEAMFDAEASDNGQKKESKMSYTVLDEDTIEVTVVAEYIEDIAQKIRIE